MPETRRSFPAWRLVALAALAGALAGAVAVYVSGTMSGNKAAVGDQAAADRACAAKTDLASTIADAATGQVAAMLAADPPRSLRALAFDGPDSRPMTLADRAGKTVLLNLWATWCAPCRAEMPALDSLQAEMGSDGFEVVAVNLDTGGDEGPKAFLSEIGVSTLAFYRDGTLDLFNELKREGLALGLPVTLLIDAEGCLLAHMNGPAEWSGADARKLVQIALGG